MHRAAVSLSVVLLAAAGVWAGVDLELVNPGFEQLEPTGAVVGWRLLGPASTDGATVAAVDDGVRSGIGALRLALEGHGRATVESAPVSLEVGALYRLSGWIRTEGAVADPLARYPSAVPACLTMASFPFTNHSPAVGGSRGWTRVETLFFATMASDRVRLHLGLNGEARGAAWFDDVRLEKVDDVTAVIPLETVRWAGRGFRYDDRGWIVLHVEGAPYERGWQMGSLVADEIVAYMAKLAYQQNQHEPEAGWRDLRFSTDALFLRKYDREYLEEMRGIADGASAAGARWHGRELELLDVAVLNSVIDLGQLEDALEVTPHALTGESFLSPEAEMEIAPERHKCSSFSATGPATADGGIVFGQIFMWGGYTGVHWNVLVDLVPTEGHRLVYHTFPGGIHSGADFYLNSAGIVIGETTVAQTPFEPSGTPQSNRIRKAAQYASSIDDVERILWQGNNGMYTNDWPIADVKTGEAAILLLGTHRKRLWRTSDDPAPFGLPGFLWANNNNRDDEVRKEYLAQPDDRPFDLMFAPWNRDVAFNEFYHEHAGRIDQHAAIGLWASSPVNRAHACDGKITTSAMAEQMMVLAHHGKTTLREKFPTRGWRYLPDHPDAVPHLALGWATLSPLWVTERLQALKPGEKGSEPAPVKLEVGDLLPTVPRGGLWRGTVLPASDAEAWFVSGSAAYWRLLDGLPDDAVARAEALAAALAGERNRFLYTVAREEDLAARDAHRAYDRYAPYRVPRVKGLFALHQLHLALGGEAFLDGMGAVHERYRERPATTAEILEALAAGAGRSTVEVERVVRPWLEGTGLPQLEVRAERRARRGGWEVVVDSVAPQGYPELRFHVAVEAGGERRLRRLVVGERAVLSFSDEPLGLEANVLSDVPVALAEYYEWGNLVDDFDDLIIVYGSAGQDEANHTLARRFQETVADAYIEILPPLVKASELDDAAAAAHDLIVLGSSADNELIARLADSLPLQLGPNWFRWQGRSWTRPDDGLLLVLPNPFNPDRALYLFLANSALQLHDMTRTYHRGLPSWARFRGGTVVERGAHAPEGMSSRF